MIVKAEYQDVPSFCREFLFYLKNVRNLSVKTVSEYYLDLRTYFRFISVYLGLIPDTSDFHSIDASVVSLADLKKITLSDLYAYLNFLNEQLDNSSTTRMRKTSSLKTFYKFLNKQNIMDDNPTQFLDTPHEKKRLPKYLTVDQSMELLESIDGKYKVRNFAIITLFLNCGLRLAELVGINLDSINGNALRVIGKGNKERILYLNQACVDAITDYLKERPADIKGPDRNALFISRNGKRISRRMVQTMVEQYLDKAGLDTDVYSTHKLRHTAATLMHQNGVDVRVLQELLGHANLSTTQIYTHIEDKEIKSAIESNPLGNVHISDKKDESDNND